MTSLGRVLLIGDDLMFRSRLEAAVRAGGGRMLPPPDGGGVDAETVFVDLNRDAQARLDAIASLRERRPDCRVIAFCHHGDKRLREAAMQAGADQCVTNGALPSVALRLAGVPTPSGDGE